jgi:hypothetical protein
MWPKCPKNHPTSSAKTKKEEGDLNGKSVARLMAQNNATGNSSQTTVTG